jgi:predicted anti-sigma-YlaC factor YlaD
MIIEAGRGAQMPLNCDECFVVLEYLAEVAVYGATEKNLRMAVHRHLDQCPDCREHHLQRLAELESKIAHHDRNSG